MNKRTFLIVGKHAVVAALKNPNRKILKLFLTEESRKNIHRESKNQNLLKNKKIFFKTKKELDKYCKNENIQHQGYIAEIEDLERINLKDFIKNKKKLNLVCLDNITDPRNIGSIVRSAASFEIDGIIAKERSFPIYSKLLYKSSSGCMELINIFLVTNINSTIKYLRESNFWIYGFDVKGDKKLNDIDINQNKILLFGSEGDGIKKHTHKYLDYVINIKINEKVESLNVSNTASIVFHNLYNLNKSINI